MYVCTLDCPHDFSVYVLSIMLLALNQFLFQFQVSGGIFFRSKL